LIDTVSLLISFTSITAVHLVISFHDTPIRASLIAFSIVTRTTISGFTAILFAHLHHFAFAAPSYFDDSRISLFPQN
jgi:hypothetical protein